MLLLFTPGKSHRLLFGWLLALLSLLPLAASATHIVGGEMELQHLSGNTYALTLNLYFDDVNGNPKARDPNLMAGIFDKATNRRMLDVVLPLTSDTFVNYTNPACATGSLRTRKLVYTKNITLDAATYNNATGYYAAVERCCRNNSISNIVKPQAAAQTFYLEFPPVTAKGQAFIDSTPRIFPPLGDYACMSELFYYDFGGTDPDGDSLAYDMVTPLNGHTTSTFPGPGQAAPAPYIPITWTAGLGVLNQIPGAPALGIDAQTGRLTVRPSQLGLFVFGVRCSEYRKGRKIGETRRDFQLYVLQCPKNAPPTLTVQNGTSNNIYRPGIDTMRFSVGSDHCLRLRYTDPDPNSVLTMSTRAVNFSGELPSFTTSRSGTVHGAGQPDTLTATLCFPDCIDTKGKVFLLDVLVADNGCSLPKRDTIRVAFTATLPPNTAPELTSTFPPAGPELPPVPVVVRLPLGTVYEATLRGTDADQNPLTLTAEPQGFDLAAAGMEFAAQNGQGLATGTFHWLATCGPAGQPARLVTFHLAESGPCQPIPRLFQVRFEVVPTADSVEFRPPNIITPNGDGRNDLFTLPDLPPDFCEVRFAEVKIFSRWGQQVYQSPERSFSWGGAGIAGTYFYLVTYTDGRRFKGWLEVVPKSGN